MRWAEEPPPFDQKRPRIKDEDIGVLRTQPGRWAVMAEYRHESSAYRSATNLRERYPDIEFRVLATDESVLLYGRAVRHKETNYG